MSRSSDCPPQSLDLAIIGNCQISALIDGRGSVVWACFPRFDSASAFGALVCSERGGRWTIEAVGEGYEVRSAYAENTCILRTTWRRADSGEGFEVIDFAPRFEQRDRSFRPTLLVRIVRCLAGRPRLRVVCRPRFDYGRRAPHLARASNHITFEDPASLDRMRLTTNASLTAIESGSAFELTRDLYFALAWDEPFEASFMVLEDFLLRTDAYWRSWCKRTHVPVLYQDVVLRASMALKLHTYEDTGAVIAAATTSIPESPASERTWDYRYCWLRDAAFVIRSLLRTGHSGDAGRFCEYLRNLLPEDGGTFRLQPVYGIDGRADLRERTLEHLSGYRGHGPVRVGNQAFSHVQNDVYGEVILALAPLFYDARLLGSELEPVYEAIERLVGAARRTFEEPDAGVWEYRHRVQHHVFSKLMGWAALDRGARIAERIGREKPSRRWRAEAERMRAQILARGYSRRRGAFVSAYDSKELDASLLFLPLLGFLAPEDARVESTLRVMLDELVDRGQVYRYRHPDDFGLPTTAFTLCSTWMVEALHLAGHVDEAVELFDRLLAIRNRFGLLSEDIDPRTGELWGNFPQTYSMLGLVNCAFRLSPPWDAIF